MKPIFDLAFALLELALAVGTILFGAVVMLPALIGLAVCIGVVFILITFIF